MIPHAALPIRLSLLILVAMGLLAVGLLPGSGADSPKGEAMPRPLPLDEALRKARVDGKYAMLLRQFKLEKDYVTHKEFHDLGYRAVTEYAGQTDLPRGHWVYVYPYWYVWRDLAAVVKPRRNWGPEQATGEPDTTEAGDIVTAWASRTPDEEDEWLLLEYAEPLVPKAVVVYETYNPGALAKVSVFKLDGSEVEVWKGKDPTPPDEAKGVSVVPIKVDFPINRVKIYLNSRDVPGWNEIDAVGLRDKDGKTHWAASAEASSTYAEFTTVIVPPMPAVSEERVRKLEEEVRELKRTVEELKKMLKKDR